MSLPPLQGIHHVTAIARDPKSSYEFMTHILGLRLIKQTVNFDQPDSYHFYFTDAVGTAGSDLTFFFLPKQLPAVRGSNMIAAISFRVVDDHALGQWAERLASFGIESTRQTRFGDAVLTFEDADGQVFELWSDTHDPTPAVNQPWDQSPVDAEIALRGLGPVTISVVNAAHLAYVLTDVLGFHLLATAKSQQLFALGTRGHSQQLIIDAQPNLPIATQGYGMGHHIAFITEDQASLQQWVAHLGEFDLSQSGIVDRYYFQSDYFRPSPQLLFEVATRGPRFFRDETPSQAGQQLVLPPWLAAQRQSLQPQLPPFQIGGAT
ncbi:VOC family protein [Lacticaseibacillus porcinae]|uniref:VOC family protein n=1 Tax=Lacticaseibacillus porcinae TaxID=1123687 RepID=UPI000F792795|nr:VOC family protein [Lacticaseibacillus porcinae]